MSDSYHLGLRLNRRLCSSDTYGRLFAYEKTYDRVTTKSERPLQLVDRIKYNTTTSDDPVMQDVRSSTIFADEILTITH